MRVGITYDLRDDYLAEGFTEEETAEFDRKDTIEAIDNTLKSLGFETDRIGHVKNLVKRLAAGERWDLVFNFAEGVKGFGREAQIPALLEAYNIPYTASDALVLALTLHKGMTKHVIKNSGIPTPDFFVVECADDILNVNLPYPIFAKPVAEGTGKGITPASKITNKKQLHSVCRNLLERFSQPVLLETFLPGREFTVAIVGTGKESIALGVLEIILKSKAEKDVYSYVNKENCEELVEYRLVNDDLAEAAKKVALDSWKALGGRDFGRVDLRCDAAGVPNFIEVNPLPGMHPEHSDLPIICTFAGIKYRELMEMIMTSALKRLKMQMPVPSERPQEEAPAQAAVSPTARVQ